MAGSTLQIFHTHLAAAHPGVELPSFQRLRNRLFPKLPSLLHRGQPEAVLVGKVVAGTTGAAALDERSGPKVLKAGAGGDQGLTTTLSPGSSVHEEGVTDPEAAPAQRALWDGDVLAVHGNGL